MFEVNHLRAEPAWNGFLHTQQLPNQELFALMKPHFIKVFGQLSHWQWDAGPSQRLHDFLIVGCKWNNKLTPYLDFKEARSALQNSNDVGRAHALWSFAKVVNEEQTWKSFGKRFLKLTWPYEVRFQSESTAQELVTFAAESRENFPDVVRTILPFLVSIQQLGPVIHCLQKTIDGDDTELANRFSEPTLALLDRIVPDDPRLAPYDLILVLNVIAKSLPHLRQDRRWRRLHHIATRT